MNSIKKPNILEVLKPAGDGAHVVNKQANEYLKYYGEKAGERKENAVAVANHYYDLVTDFYEYGWGESFHFAVMSKHESREHAFAKHEYRLALKLQAKPGDTLLVRI